MILSVSQETALEPVFRSLALLPDPEFEVQGTLYFLDGHYLFRHKEGDKFISKFVTSADLAAAFSQSEQDSGWMDPGVVRVGSNTKGLWTVYSAPAQKVEIRIDKEDVILVPIPRTVMLGNEETWWMWALKEKYFEANAAAYNAPFPNVYADGKICWGQNKAPRADATKGRENWWKFFSTPFNGDLANGKSQAEQGDIRVILRRLAEEKAKTYPLNDLVETESSIGRLIDKKLGDL